MTCHRRGSVPWGRRYMYGLCACTHVLSGAALCRVLICRVVHYPPDHAGLFSGGGELMKLHKEGSLTIPTTGTYKVYNYGNARDSSSTGAGSGGDKGYGVHYLLLVLYTQQKPVYHASLYMQEAGAGQRYPRCCCHPSPRRCPAAYNSMSRAQYVAEQNATRRWFHPTRKHSTGWFKVPPAVPLSPAVPFSTRV